MSVCMCVQVHVSIALPVTGWSGWAVTAGWAGRVGWAQPPAEGQTEDSDLRYLLGTSTGMEGPEHKDDFGFSLYHVIQVFLWMRW